MLTDDDVSASTVFSRREEMAPRSARIDDIRVNAPSMIEIASPAPLCVEISTVDIETRREAWAEGPTKFV